MFKIGGGGGGRELCCVAILFYLIWLVSYLASLLATSL